MDSDSSFPKVLHQPLLSVLVLSYQHANFISACLDSILAQEVNFPMEIVVGDDASSDGTREILEKYQEQHPEMIKLRLEEQNQGVFLNVSRTWQTCKGKFIALVEGDDAWNNPEKLQFQVDFLIEHAEYAGCFHDVEIKHWELGEEASVGQYLSKYRYYSQFNTYSPDIHPWDLIQRKLIPTASLVLRKSTLPYSWDEWPQVSYSLGELLKLMAIRGSKFRYFNAPWAIHNNHSGGITKKNAHRKFIDSILKVFEFLLEDEIYKNYSPEIYAAIAKEHKDLFFSTDPRNDPPVNQQEEIEQIFAAKVRHAVLLRDKLMEEKKGQDASQGNHSDG